MVSREIKFVADTQQPDSNKKKAIYSEHPKGCPWLVFVMCAYKLAPNMQVLRDISFRKWVVFCFPAKMMKRCQPRSSLERGERGKRKTRATCAPFSIPMPH